MQPVARIGDTVTGYCNGPGHALNRPFVGQWVTGSPTVKANNIAVIRLGDTGLTDCGHVFTASTASGLVKADGIFIHRVGDSVLTEGNGPGTSTTGSPTVVLA